MYLYESVYHLLCKNQTGKNTSDYHHFFVSRFAVSLSHLFVLSSVTVHQQMVWHQLLLTGTDIILLGKQYINEYVYFAVFSDWVLLCYYLWLWSNRKPMMQKNTTPLQALLMAVQMCQCDAAGKRYGHQFWRQKSYLLCWLFKNHGNALAQCCAHCLIEEI